MKKTLLIAFLFLFGINSFSQEGQSEIPVDIKMTQIFKDKKKFTSLAFSTKDGNEGVFIGRRYKKGYYIEHYNKDIKQVKNYDFQVDKKNGLIEAAFISGNNLCLVEYLYNKKSNQIEYYINVSPKETFAFKRSLLFAVPFEDIVKRRSISFGFFGGGSADSDVLGNVQTSKNQNYIAFTVDIKNKDTETHRIFVYDNALNKQYQTEFKRGIKDRKFILQNIDIDESDGTVYLLGKTYTKEKKKKKEGGKYQYELYKINSNSKQSLIFDSKDNYVASLTTAINNGKLFCVGFYSEKNDNRYKGLAYFDVNADDMTLKSQVYSPFTDQFIIDKYGKEKQKELRNIDFRDLHITENNECILNAEEFFITTHSSYSQQGGWNYYYVYHYNDIVSAKIDASGKLIWARNINKAQTGTINTSYVSTYYNGKTYFFINGSDKVKKLKNNRIKFKDIKIKRSNLYVISLDADGNIQYKKLLDDKDAEVPFFVNRGIVNNNGKDIILQGRRKNKKRVLKLSL